MKKFFYIPSILLFLTVLLSCSQSRNVFGFRKTTIEFNQIKTDSLFESKQKISFLTIPERHYNRFRINFGYNILELQPTSTLAYNKNAIAAINGGFFDMDSTISVNYFEINDTVINKTRPTTQKGGLSRKIMNGAVVVTKDNKLYIQKAKSDQFYEMSKQETAVLVSGPLLLLNSKITDLPDVKFVRNRHPRTCLCKKQKSLVFVTIDGRSNEAAGMSLYEVQHFLNSIGCIDAINLDGGGSTTMWIKEKGVVNFPSDSLKERSVSNALLVIKKKK